ncbi:hypothetical protein C8R44DRAFT_926049 [Mycena epipterygia]|nr:hypothetical protein C8R44DRAFT_926049 [Mycena epipterygia]
MVSEEDENQRRRLGGENTDRRRNGLDERLEGINAEQNGTLTTNTRPKPRPDNDRRLRARAQHIRLGRHLHRCSIHRVKLRRMIVRRLLDSAVYRMASVSAVLSVPACQNGIRCGRRRCITGTAVGAEASTATRSRPRVQTAQSWWQETTVTRKPAISSLLFSVSSTYPSSESGKSTIIKQMKIIHQAGFDDRERAENRTIIYKNVLDSAGTLARVVRRLGVKLLGGEREKWGAVLLAVGTAIRRAMSM